MQIFSNYFAFCLYFHSPRSQLATLNDGSDNLKSQFATSSEDSSRSQFATLNSRGHNIKHLPYAYTENGISIKDR